MRVSAVGRCSLSLCTSDFKSSTQNKKKLIISVLHTVSHNVSGVRNAWKMRNVDKEKWYVLYTKSAEEKAAWMSAFQKERARVAEDEKTG